MTQINDKDDLNQFTKDEIVKYTEELRARHVAQTQRRLRKEDQIKQMIAIGEKP